VVTWQAMSVLGVGGGEVDTLGCAGLCTIIEPVLAFNRDDCLYILTF
jgi:hypothetical protein